MPSDILKSHHTAWVTQGWIIDSTLNYTNAGGEQAMNAPELLKPLNVKRDEVIKKLDANFAEEKKKREEAEAKEKAARAEVTAFLTDHADQVAGYFADHVNGRWSQLLEELTDEVFKDDNYKPKDSVPGRLETELEKFVRVLKMSADETIEILPTQPIFNLL